VHRVTAAAAAGESCCSRDVEMLYMAVALNDHTLTMTLNLVRVGKITYDIAFRGITTSGRPFERSTPRREEMRYIGMLSCP